MGQPLQFLFIFVLFKYNFTRNVDFGRIRTRIAGVKGKHADHLTNHHHHGPWTKRFSDDLVSVLSKIDFDVFVQKLCISLLLCQNYINIICLFDDIPNVSFTLTPTLVALVVL